MGIGTFVTGGLSTLTLGVVGNQNPRVRAFVVHTDGSVTEEPNMRAARDSSFEMQQGTFGAVGLTMGAIAGGMALQSRLGQTGYRLAEAGLSTSGITAARWGIGMLQGSVGLLGALGVGGALLAMNGADSTATNWLKERMTPQDVVHVFYDENGTQIGEKRMTRSEELQQMQSSDDTYLDFSPESTDQTHDGAATG